MGIFTKSKKQEAGRHHDNQTIAASDKTNLFLYLSDTEWRAQFVSPNGAPAGEPIGEALVTVKKGGQSFADSQEIVQRALKKISGTSFKDIGSVSILLSDSGITLLDNLDSHFSSANVAKIRQFGSETLHCGEVTYGFTRFGAAEAAAVTAARPDQGVFAFADVAVLRRYLGELDRLAIKTAVIAPASQNTIYEAQPDADQASCSIYMGSRSTQIVICNATRGTVTTRKIPIGLYTLIDAVAQANNVSLADALAALSRRDCLSQVLISTGQEQAENHVPGQYERILGDIVRTLGNEIERTLDFFDIQRMGGRPDTIKIYGPVAQIDGLATWLGNRLGIAIRDANATILDDLVKRPRTEGLNLLEGAKGALITLGRVKYAWDKDRFLPEHELDSDEIAEENAAAGIIAGKPVATTDKPPATPRISAMLGRSKTRTNTNKRPRRGNARSSVAAEAQKSGRMGYVFLALFAFVSLYGGYKTFIAPKVSQFDQLTNTYIGTLGQNASLRTKVIREMASKPVERLARTEQDKVLWTEKFLALGCYASKAVWLTDVFLTTATTSATGKLENIQKLTIKGAILPSTDGHLLEISEYIRRLEEDRRGLFMGDFKRITFEGAAVDYEDVEEIIRFTIEGWYDKTKPRSARKSFAAEDLSMAACLSSDKQEALLDPAKPSENPGKER